MPRLLYNEGRVVGYSAYEIYVRQLYAVDPTATPASEKEWLASMLAIGSTMLLRVGSDSISGPHYRDIQFPVDSRLCAAGTILASFFNGDGYIGDSVQDTDSVWATRVTSYGELILNTSTSSPSGSTTHDSSIPASSDISISDDVKNQITSYMKIIDGIMIQPGTWVDSANTPPQKDFQPSMSDYPRIRLSFADAVDTPFYILLTGFTDKGVIYGVSSLTSSTDTNDPENGDFLGPAAFPWSAKVIFSVPPFAMEAVYGDGFEYTRKFPKTGTSVTVDDTPIIDYESAAPNAKTNSISSYGERYDDSSIQISISALDISRSAAALFGTYSLSDGTINLPPAIYGSIVSSDGDAYMYPLDIVAPDTLHLYQSCSDYDGESAVRLIETKSGGARAFLRNPDTYTIHELDRDTNMMIPVASTKKVSLFGALVSEPKTFPMFFVEGSSLRSGLTQKWTGSDFGTSGHVGGTDVPADQVGSLYSQPELWYIEVDDSIASQYTLETIRIITGAGSSDYEDIQGLSGETVMSDRLIACKVGCMIYRRLTGKFSDVIKEMCGYIDIYDSNGDPVGQFATGGVWGANSNARYLFEQIDSSERQNYYAVFPSNAGNSPSYPVRESDNLIDVTSKYIFDIYVNGSTWNIPHFINADSSSKSSKYLGTWWNATPNADYLTADTYLNGWAYVGITGVSHPTAYSAIADQTSGQIYQQYAMLPNDEIYSMTMLDVFGTDLADSGILEEYQQYTVLDFMRTAMYTDMGTGERLPYTNPNIKLATSVFTNGYDESTGTYDISDMHRLFSLDISNSAETVDKTQIVTIPDEYLDKYDEDPVGVLIESGRQQAFALSMTDRSNKPYPLYGTSGDIDVTDPGILTWETMLKALSTNKSINVIGNILTTIAEKISGCGDNYIEFADSGSQPIRLYVSRTEPDDSDIPNGSVGIGWGSGVHVFNTTWS